MNQVVLTGLAIALTAASYAAGECYYVSDAGSDDSPGTEVKPFASLARAEAAVEPGDVVVIEDGDYHLGRGGLKIQKSGVADRPITYRTRHPGRGVLRASERVAGFKHYKGNLYRALLGRCPSRAYEDGDPLHRRWEDKFTGPDDPRIQRGHYVWFDGYLYVWPWEDDDPEGHRIDVAFDSTITLAGTASHRVWEGLVFEHGYFCIKWASAECRDHVIRNCLFINSAGGIGGGGNSLIEHCTFYNIGPSKFEHGIYDGQENTIIRYNHFERISGGALHLYKNPRAMTVCYNTIGPPKTTRVTDPGFQGMHVGIYAWGKEGGHRVFRNVIYGGHRIGISLWAPNSLVAHNTIVDTTCWGLLLYRGPMGNRVVNNIVTGKGLLTSLAAIGTHLDYNLYAGSGRWGYGGVGHRGGRELESLADFQRVSGQEAHGTSTSDPGFVRPSEADYRILPGSPAIDAGVAVTGVTGEFAGAAPDLGALESSRSWAERPGVGFPWRELCPPARLLGEP